MLSNAFISRCGRLINTTVVHRNHLFAPFTLTVVYFPASGSERSVFLRSDSLKPFFPPTPHRHAILGDFNYTYANHFHGSPRQAPSSWLEYVDRFFVDSITAPGYLAAPTFENHIGRSCIDYCLITKDMLSSVNFSSSQVNYLPLQWTDHRLLSFVFRLLPDSRDSSSASAVGRGFWKAHPRIATDIDFQTKLAFHLSKTVLALDSSLPALLKWEKLKSVTAQTARAHSRRQAYSLTRAESLLQRKRAKIESNIMSNPSLHRSLSPQLQVVQDQLSSLQRYHVETLSLKAGIRWREKGELSAGYLKRTASARLAKTSVPLLFHPSLNRICTSKDEMLDAAFVFYDKLYTPDPIDLSAVDSLLEAIPQSSILQADESSLLTERISFDDILDAFSRCPRQSSPGLDGLPYAVVKLIVLHPDCRDIVVQVYNDALLRGIFPPSWLSTSFCLLPKRVTYPICAIGALSP